MNSHRLSWENPLDPAFHLPRTYSGELIGIDYLYSQTGPYKRSGKRNKRRKLPVRPKKRRSLAWNGI